MPVHTFKKLPLARLASGKIVLAGVALYAGLQGTALPNPYKTIERWGQLPEGRTWGSSSAIDIGPNGHLWVAERCGANELRGDRSCRPCSNSIRTGKLVKSFGAGVFVFPHGMHVDRDGNVWVTDAQRPGMARGTRSSSSARTASC